MNGNYWTDERVELLKKLWTEELSASEIAGAMGGLTRSAVLGKVHRLNLTSRAAPPRTYRTVARVWAASPKRPSSPPSHVSFIELKPHHCRYPIGETKPFLFCGTAKQTDSSYCPHHHYITHSTSQKNISQQELERRTFHMLRVVPMTAEQKFANFARREEGEAA